VPDQCRRRLVSTALGIALTELEPLFRCGVKTASTRRPCDVPFGVVHGTPTSAPHLGQRIPRYGASRSLSSCSVTRLPFFLTLMVKRYDGSQPPGSWKRCVRGFEGLRRRTGAVAPPALERAVWISADNEAAKRAQPRCVRPKACSDLGHTIGGTALVPALSSAARDPRALAFGVVVGLDGTSTPLGPSTRMVTYGLRLG
jgi:hypothetical protein